MEHWFFVLDAPHNNEEDEDVKERDCSPCCHAVGRHASCTSCVPSARLNGGRGHGARDPGEDRRPGGTRGAVTSEDGSAREGKAA